MAIIGISGTSSVGKTTLVNALKKQGFNVVDEPARFIMPKYCSNMNDNEKQLLLGAETIYNHLKYDNHIFDRCWIDACMINEFLLAKGVISQDVYDYLINKFTQLHNPDNIYFYIKPEFSFEYDGFRKDTEDDRIYQDELFNQWYAKYDIQPVILSGSTENRIKQLRKYLNI